MLIKERSKLILCKYINKIRVRYNLTRPLTHSQTAVLRPINRK